MKTRSLRIFSFEGTPQELVMILTDEYRDWFKHHFTDVAVHSEDLVVPRGSYVKSRRQYKAQSFLEVLEKQELKGAHALGLVNLDLFVPHLNFIFGTAQVDGNAVVALSRLRQSFYGLPDDESLFFRRTAKEVIHELGHVLGLGHCSGYCVMQFSNSLTDTDNKPDSFCTNCLQQLE